MIKTIYKNEYNEKREYIEKLIKGIYKDDNDVMANSDETMNHLDSVFETEGTFLLLNIDEDKLLCMANFLEFRPKEWCVFAVFTRKEYREQGLAENLVQFGIDIIKQKAGEEIVAGISKENIASQKLHEKLGFKYLGETWDQVGSGFPKNHLAYIYKIDNAINNKTIDVVGTMFFKDGKLLIDKPRKRPTFQMIGGRVEDGETNLQAAIRECHEELGENAIFDKTKIKLIMDFEEIATSDPNLKIHMYVFEYEGDLEGELTASEEIENFMWFGKNDDLSLLSNTLRNKIIPYAIKENKIF